MIFWKKSQSNFLLTLSQFLLLLFLSQCKAQRSGEEGTEDDDEGSPSSELTSVKVRVFEIPGEEYVRVFGTKQNVTDTFGKKYNVKRFLGIPFALPPIKNLRFQRPTLKVLTEDFRATIVPPPCPQLSAAGGFIGKEDCLFLSIFLADENNNNSRPVPRIQEQKLPVLIWFHGEHPDIISQGQFGVLTSGSSNELDPLVFLYKKVLVVTPQYRLGSLGFLSTANEDLNGNMGLFDMLLAVEWVQRFIGDFGGDKKQVTLMGHGSAGIALGLLATSDMARGLFHRLILMSGSPHSPMALDPTPKVTFNEIALQNTCPAFPTLQFARCMQDRKLEGMVQADSRLLKGKHLGKMRPALPVVQREGDGRFLPPIIYRNPSVTITEGNFEPVPLIIGVSSAEMSGFLPSLAGKNGLDEVIKTIFTSDAVLKNFVRSVLTRNFVDPALLSEMVSFEYFSGLNITLRHEQATDLTEELLSDYLYHIPALTMAKTWSRFAAVYFYVFDYVPGGSSEGVGSASSEPQSQPLVASHGTDLKFLMTGHKGSALDRKIHGNLLDFWINFIHKGSPLNAGGEWPQFREDSKDFLSISDEIEPSSGFRTRQDQFWSSLVPIINTRVCGSPSTSRGSGGRKSSSSFSGVFSASSHQFLKQKSPLIFQDVPEKDISKKFYTFGTSNNET